VVAHESQGIKLLASPNEEFGVKTGYEILLKYITSAMI